MTDDGGVGCAGTGRSGAAAPESPDAGPLLEVRDRLGHGLLRRVRAVGQRADRRHDDAAHRACRGDGDAGGEPPSHDPRRVPRDRGRVLRARSRHRASPAPRPPWPRTAHPRWRTCRPWPRRTGSSCRGRSQRDPPAPGDRAGHGPQTGGPCSRAPRRREPGRSPHSLAARPPPPGLRARGAERYGRSSCQDTPKRSFVQPKRRLKP